VHGKGTISINGSCKVPNKLCGVAGTNKDTESPGSNDKGKGKLVLDAAVIQSVVTSRRNVSWAPDLDGSKEGWIKLNTDADFVADTGEASMGTLFFDRRRKRLGFGGGGDCAVAAAGRLRGGGGGGGRDECPPP
jgi:hypothetical protein